MIEIIGKQRKLDNDCEIKEYYTEKGQIRALCIKDCIQSLTYMNPNLKNELCSSYFSFYDLPIELNPNGTDYLVLGGGAFSYPKYFLSHYLDKKMTVVELNESLIEYAKKYFFVDDFLNSERLNLVTADALKYVKNSNSHYDYILIDLFDGKNPVKDAYSILNLCYLKKILSKNGVIIANYIVSSDNKKTLSENLKYASEITKYFKIISTKENYDRENVIGNLLLIMSDNFIYIPLKYDYIDITADIIKWQK